MSLTKINTPSEAVEYALHATKGRIHTFGYRKTVKLPKKYQEHTLETRSRFQGQFGCFGNKASVKARRQAGEPVHECSLREVVKDILFIGKEGQPLIRVLPVKSGYKRKTYILDGEVVTKEQLKEVLPEYLYASHDAECIYLDPRNIEDIN